MPLPAPRRLRTARPGRPRPRRSKRSCWSARAIRRRTAAGSARAPLLRRRPRGRSGPPRRGSRMPRPPSRSRPGRCAWRRNVSVVMMSAPAVRYASWTARTTSGRVRTSRSCHHGRPRVVAEALAAEVGLGQAVALDQRARGAVEHENPPLQQRAKQEQALFARPNVVGRRCGPGFILAALARAAVVDAIDGTFRLGWPASFWRQCTRHEPATRPAAQVAQMRCVRH